LNSTKRRTIARIIWGLAGLSVLYVIYGLYVDQVNLRQHEKILAGLQHPQKTLLIDSFSMKLHYYPATFVDESIHLESAYVVGELRQYIGNWDDIKTFYNDQKSLENGTILIPLPLEVRQRRGRTWLDFPDGYSFSPFDADVLSALQEEYGSGGIPQNRNGTERNLYLVYASWPEDE
jgi:hypothetical protein